MFRRNGLPYLFLSCGQWPHYHRPTDTPDRLSYEKMARIAEFICCLIRHIDSAAGGETVDTVQFESRLLRLAFGPALDQVLAVTGLSQANNREELDHFAARLKEAGLRPDGGCSRSRRADGAYAGQSL